MLGGVRGVTEGSGVSRHRGRFRGGDGGGGAAAPLTAAALWLIGCGWTTHNQHPSGRRSAHELYAERERVVHRRNRPDQ